MISDRKLFLDKEGNVVEAGDPEAFELLVGEGCEIPDEVAKRHGLLAGPDDKVAVATDKVPADAEARDDGPHKPHRKPHR